MLNFNNTVPVMAIIGRAHCAGALAHGFGGTSAVCMTSLRALSPVLLVFSTPHGFLHVKVDLEEHGVAAVFVN